MKLLALRLDDHDSSLCLYDNGRISYVKTERPKNIKHHAYNNIWEWRHDVAKYFHISLQDIDDIVIIQDTLKYSESFIKPFNFISIPCNNLVSPLPAKQLNHHLAHSYSGWMLGESEYQIVIDGFGDVFTTPTNNFISVTVSVYKNHKLIYEEVNPMTVDTFRVINSIGVEYEGAAIHCGITAKSNIDLPGKLMAYKSYGKANKEIADLILRNKKNLSFVIDDQRDKLSKEDHAATIHYVLEQIVLDIFRKHIPTDAKVFYSGGCALNINWNDSLRKEYPNLLIAPHSADDGLTLGAIEWLRIQHSQPQASTHNFPYWQHGSDAGQALDNVISITAQALADGEIIAWAQGMSEIGPRALGNRSFLFRPESADKFKEIKKRESYRPFGVSILAEYADQYFDHPKDKFMLYSTTLKKEFPKQAVHIDNTCRIQTVDKIDNLVYYKLIKMYYELTGIPYLVNTSLNLDGDPIAYSLKNCEKIFYETNVDKLVYGDLLYDKKGNIKCH